MWYKSKGCPVPRSPRRAIVFPLARLSFAKFSCPNVRNPLGRHDMGQYDPGSSEPCSWRAIIVQTLSGSPRAPDQTRFVFREDDEQTARTWQGGSMPILPTATRQLLSCTAKAAITHNSIGPRGSVLFLSRSYIGLFRPGLVVFGLKEHTCIRY